jgi:hypothetical protein
MPIKSKNKKTIKENVKTILQEVPESRNNDRVLFMYYWALFDEVDFECFSFDTVLDQMRFCTPPSAIQRVRQILQHEMGEFTATDVKVKTFRERKEQVMRLKHERMKELGF